MPLLDPALVHRHVTVSDKVVVGLLWSPEKGNTLGILICDPGAKSLSTDLFP